ncbi:MAG: glycerol-3-phosphate dehydrogenase/oxidase [Edaphobacter sp.]|uniref:glycerol-3-phosphate dehydrogenase/oxidase n=1 Tax=Edaphobacter sp. TaxID=1934404 RepID=UPI002399FB1B|nr:glycerol-3-phosphate dehydrogenase/oxidase [Edaphobacter sp.]MDE1175780.1 glycerol-3-phosphate dehydrogenase/oxidase [Edaphobacter sp.]
MSDRAEIMRSLGLETQWDILIIGGGATGLGAAVEAASRGYKTVLIERTDFAKGTSSRSTKLVHGGVRYLEQMNITLVLDALQERGHMLANAPHLVHDLSFVVPVYDLFGLPYYGFGLKVYELLSGKLSFGPSKLLSSRETTSLLPGVKADGLRGGVLYHDGQFDDSRYAVTLMRTFQDLGGTAINYVEATGLIEANGKVAGVHARDLETGTLFDLRARVTINATGVFTEQILAMDNDRETLLSVSQGSHFVLPADFLPTDHALMIPKTSDGRVLFAIPWHGHTVVGTTDEAVERASVEPHAMEKERAFLLDHITKYLGRRPAPEQIQSVWSGLRPLVRKGGASTSKLSRDHSVIISPTGLVTVTGGKWTTYRRMGEDAINRSTDSAGLPRTSSITRTLRLHGWTKEISPAESDRVYGTDLAHLKQLSDEDPTLNDLLHPRLPYRRREVLWAARHEMARTVEDVLARRTRALFLDARAALEAAPTVANLLAKELKRSDDWKARDLESFTTIAQGYVYQE